MNPYFPIKFSKLIIPIFGNKKDFSLLYIIAKKILFNEKINLRSCNNPFPRCL